MTFNYSIYEVPNSATEKIMMQAIQCIGDQQRYSEESMERLLPTIVYIGVGSQI